MRIQPLRYGPEDARIAGTVRLHDAAYAGTMGMQSVRWFHRYGSQSDEGDRIVTLWGADAPPATVSPVARRKGAHHAAVR